MRASALSVLLLNTLVLIGIATTMANQPSTPAIPPAPQTPLVHLDGATSSLDEQALRSLIVTTVRETLEEQATAEEPRPDSTQTTVESVRTPTQEAAWAETDRLFEEALDAGSIEPALRGQLRTAAEELHPDDFSELLASLADAINQGELAIPSPEEGLL